MIRMVREVGEALRSAEPAEAGVRMVSPHLTLHVVALEAEAVGRASIYERVEVGGPNAPALAVRSPCAVPRSRTDEAAEVAELVQSHWGARALYEQARRRKDVAEVRVRLSHERTERTRGEESRVGREKRSGVGAEREPSLAEVLVH